MENGSERPKVGIEGPSLRVLPKQRDRQGSPNAPHHRDVYLLVGRHGRNALKKTWGLKR